MWICTMFNMKHQSIKFYLSAAYHFEKTSRQGDPLREKMSLLEHALRGIKSEQAERFPMAQWVQHPITPEVLLCIRHVWEQNSNDPGNVMLWAACTTCSIGFSGPMKLQSHHYKILTQELICVMGCQFCRERLESVLSIISIGSISGNPGEPDAFLEFRDCHPLSWKRFVTKVKEPLIEAGLNAAKFTGHSFRISAATTAAAHRLHMYVSLAIRQPLSKKPGGISVKMLTPAIYICQTAMPHGDHVIPMFKFCPLKTLFLTLCYWVVYLCQNLRFHS